MITIAFDKDGKRLSIQDPFQKLDGLDPTPRKTAALKNLGIRKQSYMENKKVKPFFAGLWNYQKTYSFTKESIIAGVKITEYIHEDKNVGIKLPDDLSMTKWEEIMKLKPEIRFDIKDYISEQIKNRDFLAGEIE